MKAAANPYARRAVGKPARFDAGRQHQSSLIAKVKMGQKALQLCDDDYRAILFRETGQRSAAHLDTAGLVKMVRYFEARGVKYRGSKSVSRAADHPAAKKARALWISLYHLNGIENPSEKGLETFGRKQLGCTALQWADQSQMFKLIEALKAIGARHGWDVTGIKGDDASHALKIQKLRLLEAILEKLKAQGPNGKGLADAGWNVAGAALNLCGFEPARRQGPMSWDLVDFDMIARHFGDVLRSGEKGSEG